MEIATRRCFIEWSVQFNEDPLHDLQLDEEEGINVQPTLFTYNDVSTDVSNSEFESEILVDTTSYAIGID